MCAAVLWFFVVYGYISKDAGTSSHCQLSTETEDKMTKTLFHIPNGGECVK
jgi:hypothetical protein